MLVGAGAAPRWEIVMREMPTVFTPLTDKALIVDRRPVLGQLAQDKVDERFPLLIYEEERFGDFTARVRMQLAEGDAEQLAGLVFRLQDDRNFYVLRLSALGGNVRFYKVVNGERGPPIGRNIEVKRGEWYELKIRCRGNQIQAWLNEEEVLPTLTDSSFLNGRIGFMTKSDTVAYFSDLHVDYRPLKSLATVLVEETLELYPRLLNVRMIGRAVESGELEVLAAKNEVDIGKPAGSTERKVFDENQTYYQRTKPAAIVTAPVRDRNGDVLGVVEFHVQRFAGQTESTTLARVLPIVSRIQQRIGSAESLAE
jgi:hypothetical protein